MNSKRILVSVIIFLLLAVNWLTFHDLFEPHTVRDWLILFTSVLTFIYLGREFSKKPG